MKFEKIESISQEEIIEVPIEDVLNLHIYNPKDIRELLVEYISEASKKGFASVRIIHGKGHGVLRRITRSVCKKHALVDFWKTPDGCRGDWGSTIVYLKKYS